MRYYRITAVFRRIVRKFYSGLKRNKGMSESASSYLFKGTAIVIKLGDLTDEETDAIVCPANSYNHMRGGVAGVIRSRGGDEIEEAAGALAPVHIGRAVITQAGRLRCKFIIHAPTMVEPVAPCSRKNARLAVAAALKCASQNSIKSISFPGMGTGTGGLSADVASGAMLEAIIEFLEVHRGITEVNIVVINNTGLIKALNKVASQRFSSWESEGGMEKSRR